MDNRRYPQRPIVGVGALIFDGDKILLIERGKEPLKGYWSLPGGALETGESLEQGVIREVREETGLEVKPVKVLENFERIMRDAQGAPEYHYVLIDYVCQVTGGTLCAGDDVSRVVWVAQSDLSRYQITTGTQAVIEKGFLTRASEATKPLSDLRVKLFADGADAAEIARASANPLIRGFTTNPTLMRAAGVTDYRCFAREILKLVTDRPVSLEVLADDFAGMERQAREIASWARNVYVKIPVTNTQQQPSLNLIGRLAHSGIQVNVTALLTLDQVRDVSAALAGGAPAFVSVFAGRIADTGRDPVPIMAAAVELLGRYPNVELIWASPRELLNVFQADAIGCHIITMTNGVLSKLGLIGKDLCGYSLETVRMFYDDAVKSGYTL